MTDTLSISIHDTRLTLESDNADFSRYARNVLASMLVPPVEEPDIRVRLYWDQTLVSATTPADRYERLGRRLLLDGERIIQTEVLLVPGLQVAKSIAGTKFIVDGSFQPRSWRMKMGLVLGGRDAQKRIFAALTYYLVYFPLLEYLERTHEWSPLHASGIAWPQGAAILAGLGGVGKSTITMAFLADADARLLSENVILHDAERIYAFPEQIHLDTRSREMLVDVGERLQPTGESFSHSRDTFEVDPTACVKSASPTLFCCLRRGQELALTPVTREKALEFALSSNVLAKELNEYAQQAAVSSLLSSEFGGRQRQIQMLERLLSHTDCYDLVIGAGASLYQAVEMVRERVG